MNIVNGTVREMRKAIKRLLPLVAAAVALPAQPLITLVSFDGASNGASPVGALVQGADGNLYGTTNAGGASNFGYCLNGSPAGCGTVFRMSPMGDLTTLYTFCLQTNCPDGAFPRGLIQGANGNFYGGTEVFGTGTNGGYGTIFEITPGGTLATLYNFSGFDGGTPDGTLVQAANGGIYGTTIRGGTSGNCPQDGGCGTVFKITPADTFKSLLSFSQTDGAFPFGGLVEDNGKFYGTTTEGGTSTNCSQDVSGCGTVFAVTAKGVLTTLHNFVGSDGYQCNALTLAANGALYGSCLGGGNNGYGTIFKITIAGKFKLLYSFTGPDGQVPSALIQATDGNFYGTTQGGGVYGAGTIFRITATGTLTTLYSFCASAGCPDGENPWVALVEGPGNYLYGTTLKGGANGLGTVFSFSAGL